MIVDVIRALRLEKIVPNADAIQRFGDLLQQYPHAAAGLLQDLCSTLGRTVQQNGDDPSIGPQIATIRECFRTMDSSWPPDCHAWDQATHDFSRWLNGRVPRLQQAVGEITGWPDEKLEKLKRQFPLTIRHLRDEYNTVLASFPDETT